MKNVVHNFFFVKKNEGTFSQNLVCEIVNKVKYNIPQINYDLFWKLVAKTFKIKCEKPLFIVEEKNFNLCFAKSCFLANLIVPFNLIVFAHSNISYLKTKYFFLTNIVYLDKNHLTKKQKELLYNLNTNTYFLKKDNALKNEISVNGKLINVFFKHNFCVKSVCNKININQYYFNGNFYFFKNNTKNNKFLIKKILFCNKNNIFILNKNKIINLHTNEVFYILTTVTTKIMLAKNRCGDYVLSVCANTSKDFVVYIGKEKINVFDLCLEQKIKILLQNQYGNSVQFINKKYDCLFNKILPQKIVQAQILGENNNKYETLYCKMKNKIFSKNKQAILFKNNICKRYDFKFYGQQKTIYFEQSQGVKKIICNGVEYKNFNSISVELFKKFGTFKVLT